MSTPITDAAASKFYAEGDANGNLVFEMARLETDRAALMEALESFVSTCDNAPPINLIINIGEACKQARAALAATKANFPQP